MKTLTRGRGLALMVCTAFLTVGMTVGTAVGQETKCRDTILKSAGKYIKAQTKTLTKCNDSLLKAKDGFNGIQGRGCRDTAGKTQEKLDKARNKFEASVEKACGGDDKVCNTNDDLDINDAAIGWGADGNFGNTFTGVCPDFESSGCTNTVIHCGGVNSNGEGITDCVLCINDEVIEQTVDLLYENLDAAKFGAGSDPNKTLNKCQAALVKAGSKHVLAKSKTLGKCWAALNKGKAGFGTGDLTGCTDASGKTAEKINKSESKTIAAICKKCGGDDKKCDENISTIAGTLVNIGTAAGDDPDPLTDIGFGTSCPDVVLPYAPNTACGDQDNLGSGSTDDVIENMEEFVGCLNCVLEFKVDCADRAVVPNHEAMPAECNVCVAQTDGDPCPTTLQVLADGFTASLDAGYTGFAHDAQIPTNGALGLNVSNCDGTNRPTCGECDVSGPVETVGSELFNNHRCLGDSSISCSVDSDCGGDGPCVFFFGNPLPLSAGGVATCITNEIVGAVAGTVNVEAGTSETIISLTSRVHLGPDQANPCPKCVFDEVDQQMECTIGARAGLLCSPTSQHPVFGPQSWDCPPSGVVGTLPITLNPSTGAQTVSLTAGSPACRAAGFTGFKCNCDTCADDVLTPCRSDADCAASVPCGGNRCLTPSTNIGDPCSAPSDCIGGPCGNLGDPTKPNACIDAVCSPNPADTDTIDEGVCNAGPFDQQCSFETYRGCFNDAACRPFEEGGTCPNCFPGFQTCGFKARECFPDNGRVGTRCYGGANDPSVDTCSDLTDCPDQGAGTFCGGGSVSVVGAASTGCGNITTPQLGTLFCISPTQSASVNATGGLPGQGRLLLPVIAEFNP